MDGSGIDFVIIPVIVLPILALWLIGMYYADSHPRWWAGPSGSQREIAAAAAPAVAPPQAAVVVPPQVAAVILPQVTAEREASAAAEAQ
jgi:hypothetical protein